MRVQEMSARSVALTTFSLSIRGPWLSGSQLCLEGGKQGTANPAPSQLQTQARALEGERQCVEVRTRKL